MRLDDRWFQAKEALKESLEDFEGWRFPEQDQALHDAIDVVSYLSRYNYLAGMPDDMQDEDNPIWLAFPEVAGKLRELSALIRLKGLLKWTACPQRVLLDDSGDVVWEASDGENN